MQCTPPPPPILDLFPKACNNPLDCFPNLCCQEGGKKYCRPPKRSFLALVADVGQVFNISSIMNSYIFYNIKCFREFFQRKLHENSLKGLTKFWSYGKL